MPPAQHPHLRLTSTGCWCFLPGSRCGLWAVCKPMLPTASIANGNHGAGHPCVQGPTPGVRGGASVCPCLPLKETPLSCYRGGHGCRDPVPAAQPERSRLGQTPACGSAWVWEAGRGCAGQRRLPSPRVGKKVLTRSPLPHRRGLGGSHILIWPNDVGQGKVRAPAFTREAS